MTKILFTMRDGTYGHDDYGVIVDSASFDKLKSLGELFERPDVDSPEKLSAALSESQAEVLVTCWGSPKVTAEVYEANPQLKYMCHVAGTVRPYVDREAIEGGLLVSNWGRVIARSVAEAALMMTLSGLRHTTRVQFELHARKGWRCEAAHTEGLFGQKVGLHGLGGIAQELVKLMAPFGCEISAYSPHCPDSVFEQFGVARAETLEQLYSENRVISVHASKTDENHHIVNADLLAKMQDGAVIVNTARGAVIDTEALVAELKTGRIEAALDVFEEEPLSEDHPLRGLENCQLIPHMGGPTPDRRRDMGALGVAQVERYLAGEELQNVVTAAKYDLIT